MSSDIVRVVHFSFSQTCIFTGRDKCACTIDLHCKFTIRDHIVLSIFLVFLLEVFIATFVDVNLQQELVMELVFFLFLQACDQSHLF